MGRYLAGAALVLLPVMAPTSAHAQAPPAAATLVAPSGAGVATTPSYTWSAVADATDYYLWVNNGSGVAVVQTWYSSAAICSGASCAVTPATPLARGYYVWWIQTRNASGDGPWSAGKGFTVGAVPAAATLVAPSGAGAASLPTYTWNAVSDAAQYYLWVNDVGGVAVIQATFDASAICAGATCAVAPTTTLQPGWHTWWIQAKNASGDGPWSAGMGFTVGSLPSAATLLAPTGAGIAVTPTYSWSAVDAATSYYLWVNDAAGTPVVQTTFAAASACTGATCTITPATPLAPGYHVWWIQAKNASGDGPWSAGKGFTVGDLPGVATLLAPTGAGIAATPVFTWNAVATATDYYVWVNNPAGTAVVQTWRHASDLCSGQTCSFAAPVSLARGYYVWWIQAKNLSGEGPWSAGMAFTVGSVPGAARPVSPSGPIATAGPTYTWTPIEDVTSYYLWVNDATGPVVQIHYDAATVCTSDSCSARPAAGLAGGGHTWWVQASNASGDGPWSSGMSFTVVAPGSVGAGSYHTVAVTGAGIVWAWGYNADGQLGLGTTDATPTPTQVPNLTGVVAVAGGYAHTALLRSDGTVWTVGANWFGQLGTGGGDRLVFEPVLGLSGVVQIASGGTHVLALKSDGTVVAWGANDSGQLGDGSFTSQPTPVVVPGLSGVVSIAAGAAHSLALLSDGTVMAWGDDSSSQLGDGTTNNQPSPISVTGLAGITRIAAGPEAWHSLAVGGDGTLYAWGSNSSGQLGDGTMNNPLTPVVVVGLSGAVQLAAGGSHSTAIKADGSLWVWGDNSSGQLGTGGTGDAHLTPIMLTSPTGLIAVSAGSVHTVALTADGRVLSWGGNYQGQIGTGGSDVVLPSPVELSGPNFHWQTTTPTFTPPGGLFTAEIDVTVACPTPGATIHYTIDGTDPTEASPVVASGGTVHVGDPLTLRARAWSPGLDPSGLAIASYSLRPADPTANPPGGSYAGRIHVGLASQTPGAVVRYTTDGSEPTSASAIYSGLIAITQTSTLKAKAFRGTWDPSATVTFSYTITPAVGEVAAGGAFSLALQPSGAVWAWGAGDLGQLGDGTGLPSLDPLPVGTLSDAVAISAGSVHALALRPDATVWAWGGNDSGQIGTGAAGAAQLSPIQVAGLTNVVAVAAGGAHSLALKADGTVYAWGSNASGQLGDGTTTDHPTPAVVPALLNIVAIAAGGAHSMALGADGQLWVWGDNTYGQIGNDAPGQAQLVPLSIITDVVSIAAGNQHSLALKTDSSVWAWGRGVFSHPAQIDQGSCGETGCNTSPLTGVTLLAGGGSHSLALSTDGTVLSWGESNAAGQLGRYGTRRVASPVSGPVGAVYISAGARHSLALTATGEIWAWGGNESGQLGDGTTDGQGAPALVVPEGFAWRVPRPIISPPAGTYPAAVTVTISSAMAGAVIRYTLDGTDPSDTSAQYTAPLTIATGTTLRAQAFRTGRAASLVVEAVYQFNSGILDAPTLSPATGVYETSVQVGISAQAGALACYTLDGSDPTPDSTPYTGPFVLVASTTVRAASFRADWTPSPVAAATYEIKVAVPVFDPPGGSSLTPQDVSITTATPDARITYTSDGTAPSESGPTLTAGATVHVAKATTIRARGWKSGATPSETASAVYTVAGSVGTVAAGGHHSVVLTADGSVWAWGSGGSGQLGQGRYSSSSIPAEIPGLTGAMAVAAGANHTLVLKSDGTVWAFGANSSGQVGDGTTTSRSAPVQVSGLTQIRAIAAGDNHSVALKSDGTVWTWGYNGKGQLGNGGTTSSSTPVQVTGVSAIAIGAGGNHTLATLVGGVMKSWGDNAHGQLGDGTASQRTNPVSVSTVSAIDSVVGGNAFSIAAKSDGTAWTWGDNAYGQLGDATTTARFTPVQASAPGTVSSVAAGSYHSLAVQSDGSLWLWGYNQYGQLGDGTTSQRANPVQPSGLPAITAASGGQHHSLAVGADGSVWAWGYNGYGQVGDGTSSTRLVPVKIADAGFAWKTATPTFSVAAGTYTDSRSVTISCATPGATIYYTTDGSDPTSGSAVYSVAVAITATTTLKARAAKPGFSDSNVASALYDLAVATPSLSPGGGAYGGAQSVTISSSSPAATIYYTMDGSDPTASSNLYTVPVLVGTTTTLKARAFKSGWTASGIGSATYSIAFGTLAAPMMSPATGTYVDSLLVALTALPGATIRYTTDGADPTVSSAPYTSPLTISQTTTVKAKAWKSEYADSPVSSAIYTVKLSTPTFTLPSGSYAAGTTVTVNSSAAAASLYYTFNGLDPTESDTPIAAGGAVVLGDFTLKVRAFKAGCTASDVASANYLIAGEALSGTIVAGYSFAVLLKPDGTVWAWGDNTYGQIGNGSMTMQRTPVQASGLNGVTGIAAGFNHALAVTGSGEVWAWGHNAFGQLGDGTTASRSQAILVGGLSDVVTVAAGGTTSAALTRDGTLWLWGSNDYGQLGVGDTANRLVPVQVMSDVAGVAVGGYHVLARKTDGSVWAWGANNYGELGDTTTTARTTPVRVANVSGTVSLVAGENHSLALDSNGWVWAWGSNYSGQLCDGTAWSSNHSSPVRMPGVLARSVAAGSGHTLLTRFDGAVWACGRNDLGQLGNGTTVDSSVPVPTGLGGILAVAAGSHASFAVSADQSVWSWGWNGFSQLGDGTTRNRLVPLNVSLPQYRWRAAAPVFDPEAGTYSAGFNLVLSTASSGGAIHVTMDGSRPTVASPLYAAPLQIDRSTVVNAVTISGDGADSNVETSSYLLKVVSPQMTPGAGTYTQPTAVVMSTSTAGATIRYTTDVQLPSETSPPYVTPLTLSTNTTLRARAFKDGWEPSGSVIATYGFDLGTLAPPVFSPASGTYQGSVQVTITAAAATMIYYTLDGSDPTSASPSYSGPISLTATTTLRAKAFNLDWTPSATSNATYNVKVPAPSLSLAPGQYPAGQPLTFSHVDPSAAIRYTLDGSAPTATSTPVARDTTVRLTYDVTVTAVAYKPNCVPSDPVSATYTLTGQLPVAVVQGGDAHSLALTADTLSWAWGQNAHGQLGIGSMTDQLAPVPITSLSGVRQLATGGSHALALVQPGIVSAWGENTNGELGDGTATDRTAPVSLPAFSGGGVASVAAGEHHSIALKTDGTVLAWGLNSSGQLGDGTTISRPSPVLVSGLNSAVQVAAGEAHSLALNSDGTVVAWGSNLAAQLGDGSTEQRNTPVTVVSLSGVVALAAGRVHSIALSSAGTVWSWGANNSGQIGDGTTADRSTPVQVSGLTGVVAIAANGQHNLALRRDGSVWAWGMNVYGAVGDGTTEDRSTPVMVGAVKGAVAIGAGLDHSLAVDLDGVVWVWGSNGHGQLGDGTRETRLVPVPISQSGGIWRVATPTFDMGTGTYWGEIDVVVSCATTGAVIHYTTNGSDPTETAPVIASGAAVHVASALTLKARAFKEGQLASGVMAADYVFALREPMASPGGSTYTAVQFVTLSATPGAAIHYTLDGSDPTDASLQYSGPVSVEGSLTLKARASRSGWMPSGVMSETYVLKVMAPLLDPAGGSFTAPLQISVFCSTPGAVVHYTLDGSDPTYDSPIVESGTVLVERSTTLRTKAWLSGWATSDTSGATVSLTLAPAEPPVFAPLAGTYPAPRVVWLGTATPGAVIRYTLDGSDPGPSSPIYLAPIVLQETTTVRARAMLRDHEPSAVSVATYTVNVSGVQVPRLDPSPGSYTTTRVVSVSCPTSGSAVHFTLNGIDPVETDPQVACGGTISVDRSLILKARAWKDGLAVSAVRRGDYTITGAVSAGAAFSVALAADGKVWTWGANATGQLGDGTTTRRTAPYELSGLASMAAVTAGGGHVLALAPNGRVWSWGDNSNGQLGDGTTTQRIAPVQLAAFASGITSLSAGVWHSLALTADGRVWSWGNNAYGQLGDGTTNSHSTPALVPTFTTSPIVAVAAGQNHSVALAADGSVWSWGINSNGQLGDGTTTQRTRPVQVQNLRRIVGLVTRYDHTLALDVDGVLWGWGSNSQGALGDGSTQDRLAPVKLAYPGVIGAVGAGQDFTVAARHDQSGELQASGANTLGQLGDGSFLSHVAPVPVAELTNAAAVSSGQGHTLAIALDGTVWSWGQNADGQLGNGGTTNGSMPVQVPGLRLVDNSWLVADPDGDGLLTGVELWLGSDPLSRDSNGDGIDDGVIGGGDPFTAPPPPAIGDHTPPTITVVEPADVRIMP